MNSISRQFITESEGGAPAISPSGQRLLRFRSFLKTVNRTQGEPSGVHPDDEMFAGIGGQTPHGVRYTTPVIMPSTYAGLLPLQLQPKINKPYPWEK